MSFLRFTPTEFRAIARVRRLNLSRFDPQAFRLKLAVSLADHAPGLAERVSRFTHRQIRLLYDELRAQSGAPPALAFAPDEWRAFVAACRVVPVSARFVSPFQWAVARQLRDASPELARKLARMSLGQFARLVEGARMQRRESA